MRENIISKSDGSMHGKGERERCTYAMMSKLLHSKKKRKKIKKNKTHIYYLWRCSQANIKSRLTHKPCWCGRLKLSDA